MGNAPPDEDPISDSSSANNAPAIMPVKNATVPYWRSQLHPIDSHRTTKELPTECDIAIIGSGMSGVSSAYHLIQQTSDTPPSIVLLEAREVCSGATGRNGGHVKFQPPGIVEMLKRYSLEAVEEVVDLVLEQIYAIKQVVEAENLDCEFELRRSWNVFIDPGEAAEARAGFDKCLKAGHRWTREVNFVGEEIAEQVTSIRNARAAFSVPACSLWPYKFVSQLLSHLVDRDQVNLQTHTPVTRISSTTNHTILHTPRGKLKARKVVFATNAYTSGICPLYRDKIVPTLATATHITPNKRVSPHLAATYNIHYPPSINPGGSPGDGIERVDYLNPRPDGSIVVGGAKWTYQADGESWYNRWDDSILLPGAAGEHFGGLMQNYFKGWEASDARVDSMWTGVIGVTGDGLAHVGEIPRRDDEIGKGREYVIAGFNGGGMAFMFLCARGLAKMVGKGVEFEESGLPRVLKTTEKRLR